MATGRTRGFLGVALTCLVALLLYVSFPARAAVSDTVVIGAAQEPDVLIGQFSTLLLSNEILTSLFVGMVQFNDRWKLYPQLVEKIPTLRDGDWQPLPGNKMRVTYRFKRGYTWHDGRPVTALDTAWTHLMLRNPRSPTLSRFVLRKIDHMLVPDPNDPYTLVVQWNEVYPFANLGHSTLPRHVLEREYIRNPAALKGSRQARAPVGNGPYRFVEWVPGSHLTLEAYDRFIEGKPKIQRQVWRFFLDSTVLQANVLGGSVDVTTSTAYLSLDQMIEIDQRAPGVATHYVPSFFWEHIDLNLDNEWLKDRRVRQALAHAINREEISTKLFYAKQPVAHTWVPLQHEAHNPRVRTYAYDPARAKQLLGDAGFVPGPDGVLRDASGKRFEMEILITAGNVAREQVALVLKEQLRAVGVNLKIDSRPTAVGVGLQQRRQVPHMAIYSWNISPLNLGFSLWHSTQIPNEANHWEGVNYPGWRNAENDQLLEQISRELDPVRRVQMLRRQQEIWAEELPAIPMYYRLTLATSRKALKNVKAGQIMWNSERWEWLD